MRLISFVICLILASSLTSFGAEIKEFDQEIYHLDLRLAPKNRGQLVSVLGDGCTYAVNGGFFGSVPYIFPIGRVERLGKNYTVCTTKQKRAFIWQAEEVGIGWQAPKDALFILGGLIMLLDNGEMVNDLQGYSSKKWNEKCMRNLVATKKDCKKFYILHIYGSLHHCAKYLKKAGYLKGAALDGGSSCARKAKVSNAVVVRAKTSKAYEKYKKRIEKKKSWIEQVLDEKQNNSILRFPSLELPDSRHN